MFTVCASSDHHHHWDYCYRAKLFTKRISGKSINNLLFILFWLISQTILILFCPFGSPYRLSNAENADRAIQNVDDKGWHYTRSLAGQMPTRRQTKFNDSMVELKDLLRFLLERQKKKMRIRSTNALYSVLYTYAIQYTETGNQWRHRTEGARSHRKQPHKTFLKSNKKKNQLRVEIGSCACVSLRNVHVLHPKWTRGRIADWVYDAAHRMPILNTNLCSTMKTDLTKISWLIICVWAHTLLTTTSISLSPRNYNSSSWCWWEMGWSWCACVRKGADVLVWCWSHYSHQSRYTPFECFLMFASALRICAGVQTAVFVSFDRQLWFRAMIRFFSFASFIWFSLRTRFTIRIMGSWYKTH